MKCYPFIFIIALLVAYCSDKKLISDNNTPDIQNLHILPDGKFIWRHYDFVETGNWVINYSIDDLVLYNRQNPSYEKRYGTKETPIEHIRLNNCLKQQITALIVYN